MKFKCYWHYGLCMAVASCIAACTVEKVEQPQDPVADLEEVAVSASETSAEPVSQEETLQTASGMKMVPIPTGTFSMGDEDGEYDEQPVREVQVDAFYMDEHEVTQEVYEALMGQNPSKHKNPKQPVEQLGWYAALKFCNMRSLREGLTPCYDLDAMTCNFDADGYRLPTEAEWEYACRAGSTGDYSPSDIAEAAWFDENADGQPQAVAQKAANPWGLYDMHGNVYEWCNDNYDDAWYGSGETDNPCNFTEGEERVLRGGSWDSDAESCRSSARFSEAPGLADVCFGYDAYGFRCVRRITPGADLP